MAFDIKNLSRLSCGNSLANNTANEWMYISPGDTKAQINDPSGAYFLPAHRLFSAGDIIHVWLPASVTYTTEPRYLKLIVDSFGSTGVGTTAGLLDITNFRPPADNKGQSAPYILKQFTQDGVNINPDNTITMDFSGFLIDTWNIGIANPAGVTIGYTISNNLDVVCTVPVSADLSGGISRLTSVTDVGKLFFPSGTTLTIAPVVGMEATITIYLGFITVLV